MVSKDVSFSKRTEIRRNGANRNLIAGFNDVVFKEAANARDCCTLLHSNA